MEKDRKILTKSDGKKIISYPDGSWCDYNDLIDSKWSFEPSDLFDLIHPQAGNYFTFGEGEDEGFFILRKDNSIDFGTYDRAIDNLWDSSSWSSDGNLIEISLQRKYQEWNKDDGYKYVMAGIHLKGEIVFNEESSRTIIGNYYRDDPHGDDEGQFTATETAILLSDD